MGRKSDKIVDKFDTLIIGAGASGLMVASKYKDRDIAIIEANSKIGQKLKISGGGKCNITNKRVSYDNYLGDREFVDEVLNSFDEVKLLKFLKDRGCIPLLRGQNQYFCKDSSDEIVDVFKREIKDIPLFLKHKVLEVKRDRDFLIRTDRGDFLADRLVVASGGLSYPKIGASSIGFDIAKHFGHKVVRTSPALVGFTLQKEQFWMRDLSGISIFVKIRVLEKEFLSNILFTHRGISGPAILNSSLYWERGAIEIDFLPNVKLKRYTKNSKKLLSSAIPLPKRFLKAFFKSIELEDKRVDMLTQIDREKLSLLKSYKFSPSGNFGYQKAEVTKGGVDTSLIDSKNMMSRIVENLYFVGECLDVTGELGGYNLQWAFSSACRVTL